MGDQRIFLEIAILRQLHDKERTKPNEVVNEGDEEMVLESELLLHCSRRSGALHFKRRSGIPTSQLKSRWASLRSVPTGGNTLMGENRYPEEDDGVYDVFHFPEVTVPDDRLVYPPSFLI